MEYNTDVRESAIDWLTCTARDNGQDMLLERLGRTLVLEQAGAGDYVHDFGWRGYTGERCGPLTWGRRYDGVIFQASGRAADRHFLRVSPLASHFSRLDIQVTVQSTDSNARFAHDAYLLKLAGKGTDGRPLSVIYMEGSDGGSTCYVGSTQSEQRGRVYNKGVQSGDPAYEFCWRYEVQFRNQLATWHAGRIATSPNPCSAIAGYVSHWFRKRAIPVPFVAENLGSTDLPPADPSDSENTLRWLRTSVAPTIARFRRTGNLDKAVNALGLEDALDISIIPEYSEGAGGHTDELRE